MALTDIPGRTPLGAFYRSPLGVLTRPKIHTLLMVFCSSQREEDAADTYPIFNNVHDGTWTTHLASLEAEILLRESIGVCLIGVKRAGAINDISTSTYTTGIDLCYPASWVADQSLLPSWLTTEEWEPGGAPGASPTSSLTEADLQGWYDNAVGSFGVPEQVGIGMMLDTGGMVDGVRTGRVSPWACIGDATIPASGVPAIPAPPGTVDLHYGHIRQLGDNASWVACNDFYTTLAGDGISTIARYNGFDCRNLDTPTGQFIDGSGEGVSWPSWVDTTIVANVPLL